MREYSVGLLVSNLEPALLVAVGSRSTQAFRRSRGILPGFRARLPWTKSRTDSHNVKLHQKNCAHAELRLLNKHGSYVFARKTKSNGCQVQGSRFFSAVRELGTSLFRRKNNTFHLVAGSTAEHMTLAELRCCETRLVPFVSRKACRVNAVFLISPRGFCRKI